MLAAISQCLCLSLHFCSLIAVWFYLNFGNINIFFTSIILILKLISNNKIQTSLKLPVFDYGNNYKVSIPRKTYIHGVCRVCAHVHVHKYVSAHTYTQRNSWIFYSEVNFNNTQWDSLWVWNRYNQMVASLPNPKVNIYKMNVFINCVEKLVLSIWQGYT